MPSLTLRNLAKDANAEPGAVAQAGATLRRVLIRSEDVDRIGAAPCRPARARVTSMSEPCG
jgi:hypothetical protein